MYNVVITYTNGEEVQFPAQEFDVDFRHTQAHPGSQLNKYTYTDHQGNKTFIYLTPNQVAGIVLITR